MPEEQLDGWNQWAKHVLLELERLDKCISTTKKEMMSVRIEIASLQVKAGIWGMAAGAVPILLYIAVNLFLEKI